MDSEMSKAYAAAALAGLLTLVGSASADVSREYIAIQVRTNFVPSTTRCALDSFVVAGPAAQPEVGATVCAMGGPFGDGVVGVDLGVDAKFAGATIHLDRTFTFNNGADAVYIRTLFNFGPQVLADNGGINYVSGTWEITGGSGAYEGLRGRGTLTNAFGSTVNAPPPPEYAREELVGWVKR
jgi:hypothetical protein